MAYTSANEFNKIKHTFNTTGLKISRTKKSINYSLIVGKISKQTGIH